MGREELEKHVKDALAECQKIILKHPNVVLSEADLEKLLCKCISKETKEVIDQAPKENEYSVHTQISHYIPQNGKYKLEERVDILILDESKLEFCKEHKKDKYFGTSIAFELKYLHIGDSVTLVKDDFKKWDHIKDDSSLYIVVLLEARSENKYIVKKKKVEELEKEYDNVKKHGQNQLLCSIMMKKK
jgi:hypothetical protein